MKPQIKPRPHRHADSGEVETHDLTGTTEWVQTFASHFASHGGEVD